LRTAVFVTVRSKSTRLAGKALRKIQGQPTIWHVIQRAKRARNADLVVVCTTDQPEDDEICRIAREAGVESFRGSESDKLARWLGAARQFGIDAFVTADGDDLFCEPALNDLALQQFAHSDADFIQSSVVIPGAFTYGIRVAALARVCEIKDTDQTEMMWVYFTATGLFKVRELEGDVQPFARQGVRITLDYADDFTFFDTVFQAVSPGSPDLPLGKVLEYLDAHPQVTRINAYLNEQWSQNQVQKTQLLIKPQFRHLLRTAEHMSTPEQVNPSKYLGNELKYLEKVLRSESWSATGGAWTQNLEREFAKSIGMRYAIAFNSGTATLHAALEAVGVGAGDEVISPAVTVIMDTTATLHANAIPVYADVDPATFNIDPADVERRITSKTKAIIAVALYGLPPDLPRLRAIADRHGIALIEDNAQTLLSTINGRQSGTFGEFASYSFETTKHLSCGEGGILVTNDEALAQKARKIGGHGFKNLRAEEGRTRLNQEIFQNPDYLRHDMLGWNYRLSEFGSAVALAQLERARELVDLRIKSAQLFMEVMGECDYLTPQVSPPGYLNSYYTLGAVYEGAERIGVSWKEFRAEYVKQGGDGIYSAWAVPYLEPVMATRQFVARCPQVYRDVHYQPGACPKAELLQRKLMQFKTNYRDMSLAESKAEILRTVIKQFRVSR
jgi:perosamine synthetase